MTNPNALAPLPPAATTLADARQVDMGLGPRNLAQAWAVAEALAKSDMPPEHLRGKAANILNLVLMANDLHIGITVAMRGIYMVEGRPAVSSALKVSLVLQSGACERWDVVESSDEKCTIVTKRRGKGEASLTLTWKEVEAAGFARNSKGEIKATWRMYRRIMLRRRVESWLSEQEYPDIVQGFQTVEEAGEVVDAPETLPPRAVVASAQAVAAPVVEAAPASQLPPLPPAEEEVAKSEPPPPADVATKDPVDQLLADLAAVDLSAPDAKAKVDACSARVKDVTPTGHPRRQEVSRAFSAVRTQLQAKR